MMKPENVRLYLLDYVESSMQGGCGLVQNLAERGIRSLPDEDIVEIYNYFVLKEKNEKTFKFSQH